MTLNKLKVLLRREHWVLAGVLIVALLVVARAWFVQVEESDFLRKQAQVRHVRVLELPASRGVIYDRNGQVLALSTPVADVWVDPQQVCPQVDALRPVVKVLHRNWTVVRKQVLGLCRSRDDSKHKPARFMYLKRQVIPDVAERIQTMRVPGLYVTPTYKRYYPQAEVTAHLVGFTNIDDVGQAGLEKVFDHWLRGAPGQIRVIKDLKGQVVEFYDTVRPLKPGKDMVLALDERIQYFTYRALKKAMIQHQARAAAAIVLDAHTGEILALASQPGYNPNDRSQMTPQRTRNHAVSDLIEAGSTIKPFVMAKALDMGVVQPGEEIDTSPGRFKVGDRIVRDDHNKGVLTPTGIIKHSSNVGISKIALRLRPEDEWQLFHQLGFDRDSGLFLHGEVMGQLKTADIWTPVDQAWAAFGYGFQVSLLQLARAYLALAHDGAALPLSLFKRDAPPKAEAQVFSPEAARTVRMMMEQVTQKGGTAPAAHVPGFSVAGKTGTVHKSGRRGYTLDRYRSLFAGIIPADHPDMVMVIMVDEPSRGIYYGGQVAAPIFSEVMRQAVRLRNLVPDRPE